MVEALVQIKTIGNSTTLNLEYIVCRIVRQFGNLKDRLIN